MTLFVLIVVVVVLLAAGWATERWIHEPQRVRDRLEGEKKFRTKLERRASSFGLSVRFDGALHLEKYILTGELGGVEVEIEEVNFSYGDEHGRHLVFRPRRPVCVDADGTPLPVGDPRLGARRKAAREALSGLIGALPPRYGPGAELKSSGGMVWVLVQGGIMEVLDEQVLEGVGAAFEALGPFEQ